MEEEITIKSEIPDQPMEEEVATTESVSKAPVRQMFCIAAPANVENVENFLKCCGGLNHIQSTFNTPKERLQFKFRPEDPNAIPLFSGRKSSNDLAVKVRRKKKSDGTYDYKFETYGIIDTTFHFDDSICDLQMLPTPSDIRNELLKSDFILNCDINATLDDDQSNTTLKHFFYSRFTSPKSVFEEMSEQSKKEMHLSNQDMICQLRKSRRMFGIFVKWEEDKIPETLPAEYKSRINAATFQDEMAIKLKELFDQRPMWSRHALLLLTKCRYTKLKYILPIFAYAYVNGPFRNLWVRYGYNPKLDSTSKIYQSIDVRYRSNPSEALRNKITMFKDHSVSYKPDHTSAFHYLDESRVGADASLLEQLEVDVSAENDFVFRPGNISIFKRTIYQLCDIEMDEVQQIIHENDGQETECIEKDGWCVPGAIDRIRKLMLSAANVMLQDPEIAKKLDRQDLSQVETMDEIEVSMVYDDLSLFEDVNDLLMVETQEQEWN